MESIGFDLKFRFPPNILSITITFFSPLRHRKLPTDEFCLVFFFFGSSYGLYYLYHISKWLDLGLPTRTVGIGIQKNGELSQTQREGRNTVQQLVLIHSLLKTLWN